MQDSMMEVAYNSTELKKYKNDPVWFKKALLKACNRNVDGKIRHIEYVEKEDDSKRPIVTSLRYLRAVVPDSMNPIDDEMPVHSNNITLDTPIILTANEDEYVEPISGLKVTESLFGEEAEDIYNYTIDSSTFLVIGYNRGEIPPFGYVTSDILKMWKEQTVPYSEDLIAHLEELKKKTENNFGMSFITSEKIMDTLKSTQKKIKR